MKFTQKQERVAISNGLRSQFVTLESENLRGKHRKYLLKEAKS